MTFAVSGMKTRARGTVMSKWTVWVGGGEINDHYLDSEQVAQDLAQWWVDKGYDEVVVEEIQ